MQLTHSASLQGTNIMNKLLTKDTNEAKLYLEKNNHNWLGLLMVEVDMNGKVDSMNLNEQMQRVILI